MRHVIQYKRLTRSRRARMLAAAAVLSGGLAAGCGASAGSSSTSASIAGSAGAAASTGSGATAGGGARTSGSTTPAASQASGPLAFSRCMRANGVPDFPDPSAGGAAEFTLPPGTSPEAPAFQAARAKCRNLLPGGGPPGPGSTTHPSAQTLSKLCRIAGACAARRAPVPRPKTTVPSNPAASPGDNRLRRSGPSLPRHDEHAGAGVQAGLDGVRRPAARPPALMGTEFAAGDAAAVHVLPPATVVVALGLLVTAGVVAGDRPRHPLAGAAGHRRGQFSAAGAATVQRRDLVETDTESGTLSYADPQTVYDRLSGTITWLPAVGRAIVADRCCSKSTTSRWSCCTARRRPIASSHRPTVPGRTFANSTAT